METNDYGKDSLFAAQENEARAAVMAPVLWKIFWLMVVANVMSLLAFVPAGARFAVLFGQVATLLVAFLVLTLRDIDRRFFTAGTCAAVAAGVNLVGSLLGDGDILILLNLLYVAFSFAALYNELTALSDVVGKADPVLGRRWRNLWTYRMIALVASLCSVLLTLLSAYLAVLVVVAAAVAALVLSVMQMVYYYKTARLYDGMIAG